MAAMHVRIRAFDPQDFDRLWQIDQECFPPGISYSRQELKTYIRRRDSFTLVAISQVTVSEDAINTGAMKRGGRNLVALHHNHSQIQGFIVACGGLAGHIITIDVAASARRLGLGSQLLAAAQDRLSAEGSEKVDLETAVDNAAAIAFYKRLGYSIIGTCPRYYSNGVDALMMAKQI